MSYDDTSRVLAHHLQLPGRPEEAQFDQLRFSLEYHKVGPRTRQRTSMDALCGGAPCGWVFGNEWPYVGPPTIDPKLISALASELPVATIILSLEHISLARPKVGL